MADAAYLKDRLERLASAEIAKIPKRFRAVDEYMGARSRLAVRGLPGGNDAQAGGGDCQGNVLSAIAFSPDRRLSD